MKYLATIFTGAALGLATGAFTAGIGNDLSDYKAKVRETQPELGANAAMQEAVNLRTVDNLQGLAAGLGIGLAGGAAVAAAGAIGSRLRQPQPG